MARLAAARAAMQHAAAIGCLWAACDFAIRFTHPELAASRSALLGAMVLHALPLMLLAACVAIWRGGAGRTPAVLLPLSLLVLLGGLANILWLPGLLSPSSLVFDLVALLLTAAATWWGWRLPRAGHRARRISGAVLLLALIVGLWSRVPSRAQSGGERQGLAAGPDLIVVLFDALRADHTSVYGYERETTPNLRTVANEAVVFENAYAPSSWTKPSVATLFTGVLPASHGNHRVSSALPSGLATLPERLSSAGYRCGVFAENGFVSPLFGYDRGVERIVANEADVVAQTTAGHLLEQIAVRSAVVAPLLELARRCNVFDPRQRFKAHGGLDVVGASLAWLDEIDPDERVFLYLHLMKPHAPYTAPAPYDGVFGAPDRGDDDPALNPPHVEGLGPFARAAAVDPSLRERMVANYDERILYGDAMFGRFVEGLRERGRYDASLLVMLADHGEEFGEHGLWDHGHSLQEGVLRVPLILRSPELEPARVERIARLQDLPATLVAAAGVVDAEGIDGRDLRQSARSDVGELPVLAQLRHGPGFEMQALLRGGNKLVHSQDGGREAWQLFRVAQDPGENADRAGDSRLELGNMREELRLSLELAGRFAAGEHEVQLDATTLEKLRALGYVE